MSFDDNNTQNNTGSNANNQNHSYSYDPNRKFYSHMLPEDGAENVHRSNAPAPSYNNSVPNYNFPVPNYNNAYSSYNPSPAQPSPEPATPEKEKKRVPRAVKTIAAMLAVAVIAGASGGGVSYMILKDNLTVAEAGLTVQNPPVTEIPQSSSQETPASSSSRANDYGANGTASDISGVVEKAAQSVVEISVEVVASNPFFGQYTTGGSGSGVILTSDGYIATNDHVVEGAEKITVRIEDGTEFEAELIGTDSQSDLAVIKIDATGLHPASFADSDQIKVGEVAIAIGNPLGTLGGTVTQGIISAKDRQIDFETENGIETMTLIQTSAAVNPGNSGGGLFNANGDLVGIVNSKSSGTNIEGLGFAIPSNTVKKVTDDLILNGYVTGRPQLGISVVEILDNQTAFRYRISELGVYVMSSTEGNGLNVGDLIVSMDGKEIKSSSDVKNIVTGKAVGDTVEMIVKRDGKEITVNVTLTEKIPESIKNAAKNSET